ncbi:TP53-regulating kinase-like [Oopsacas minuta]|uniref:non-specific serine/threonine protein kinase n=1 Tax=Oopsacas minuta TaxID=111878 RepID=A0AAV7KFY7_9METZ|nr:TP53-regulating kinase-like [Oopsacas minuta]
MISMECPSMNQELFKQGAEARIYKSSIFNKPCIVKERFLKCYRHPTLHKKLSDKRMIQEARSLVRCHTIGVRTPLVYHTDLDTHKLYLELLPHPLLNDLISSLEAREQQSADITDTIRDVGRQIALMHDNDVIHGDLTTLNILVDIKSGDSYFIDFGLSSVSSLSEDKAVDLYVLERAITSSHPKMSQLFTDILTSYAQYSSKTAKTLNKLKEVRQRGRKRIMIG